MTLQPALRKGEKTRQTILAAAGLVFMREGYLNADTAGIAREAGKSLGTFYIYFKNKADVLTAMIEAFTADAYSRFGLPADRVFTGAGPAEWARVIAEIAAVFKAHAATFYALAQAARIDAGFAEQDRTLRQRARDDFLGFIKAQQAAGFCKTLNAKYAASVLEIMVLQSLMEWIAADGKLPNRREEGKAIATLTRIFTAVLQIED
jgi:AcrR family transcriptional regulator